MSQAGKTCKTMSFSENEPAGQGVQDDEPLLPENEPGGQGVQENELFRE